MQICSSILKHSVEKVSEGFPPKSVDVTLLDKYICRLHLMLTQFHTLKIKPFLHFYKVTVKRDLYIAMFRTHLQHTVLSAAVVPFLCQNIIHSTA
jgi:hypothetical protein